MNKIELWVEITGKKKQTMISGIAILNNAKDHLYKLKHKIGCNGTIKLSNVSNTHVMMLQGDHIDFIKNYIINELNIPSSSIIIRGI